MTSKTIMFRRLFLVGLLLAITGIPNRQARADDDSRVFRAGAAAIDISPVKLPVLINGNMTAVLATEVVDPLHARALVLDDGTNEIAIVIVDSCGLPRELIDKAKRLAERATGIPTDRMLIAATHAHSAPSVMAALGGYETWLARSSCLEETAEVKITSAVLDLLDSVAQTRKGDRAVPSAKVGPATSAE